jgi:hypothetical protein
MRTPLCLPALLLAVLLASPAAAQEPAPFTPQMEQTFRELSARLSADRLDGEDTDEEDEEHALELLDALVLSALAPAEPDLEALNGRLAALAAGGDAGPRLGESYRIFRLGRPGAEVRYYALAVNFGFAGPAAVRVYFCRDDRCRLAGSVDADYDPELFDENLVLIPLEVEEPVFLLVTGLSDEFRTGAFAAWRFTHAGLEQLWSTELSPRASYQAAPDGITVTYCADPEPLRPAECRRMARERWVWRDGEWRRLDAGPPPSP